MANELNIQELTIKFTTDTDDALKGIDKVKKSVKGLTGLSGSFSGIGKATSKATKSISGFARGIATLVGDMYAIKEAVLGTTKAFNDYYETLNLANVAMGKGFEESMQKAKDYENQLGINSAEWMKYQSTMANTLNGFGLSNKYMMLMSENLTQLAYDYSSLMNVPVSESFNKISSAMSGQIKGLKEYGNNASVANVKNYAMKYGLDGQVSSWNNATQAIMRYQTIMKNSEITGVWNDLARTINTPANSVRILGSQIEILKRQFGQLASVIAVPLVNAARVAIKAMSALLSIIGKLFGIDFNSIRLDVDYSNVGGAADAMDDVSDGAKSAAGNTKKATKELKKYLAGFDELNIIPSPKENSSSGASGGGGLGGFDTKQIDDFFDKLEKYNFLDDLAKQSELTLGKFFKPLKDSWDTYGKAVIGAFTRMMEKLKGMVGTVIGTFKEIWNSRGTEVFESLYRTAYFLTTAIGELADKFSIAWNNMGNGTSIASSLFDIFTNLLGIFEDVAHSVLMIANDVDFSGLLGSISNLFASMDRFVSLVREDLYWCLENVFKPLAVWTINSGIPTVINAIANAIKYVSEAGVNIPVTIAIFGALFKAVSIGSYVFANLEAIMGGVASVLASISSPITIAVAAFAGFYVMVSKAWKTSENFRNAVTKAFDTIATGVKAAFNLIIGPAFYGIKEAIDVMAKAMPILLKGFQSAFNGISTVVIGAMNIVSPLLSTAANIASVILIPAFQAVGLVVGGVFTGIIAAIGKFGEFVEWAGNMIYEGLLEPISKIIEPIVSFFEKAVESVKSVLGIHSPSRVFNEIGQYIVAGIVNAIMVIPQKFISIFTTAWTNVKLIFASVGTWFGTKFNEAYTGAANAIGKLGTFVSGLWESIKSTFTSIGTNIADAVGGGLKKAFNGAMQTVENSINTMIRMINGALGVINLIPGVNISNIKALTLPRMAEGGQVNTGQMFIAREAGPELVGSIGRRTTVANNDQIIEGIKRGVMEAMMATGGNGNGTITVNMNLDGKQIAKSVFREHNGIVTQTGISPLKI